MNPNPAQSERCCLLLVGRDTGQIALAAEIASKEFDVALAESAASACALLSDRRFDLILAQQHLGDMAASELLGWVRAHSPRTIRLAMVRLDEMDGAGQALHSSLVHRCILEPWQPEELLEVLRSAARACILERGQERLLQELRTLNLDLEERVRQRTLDLDDANNELRQQNLALQKLALLDPLTGLPNRRAMDQAVHSELRRRARYPGPLALGLIDVDNFKEINYRYLLPGGDQVLVNLATTLSHCVRKVDCIGRIGGEEFMVVAPQTGQEGATILGERIRAAVWGARFYYKQTAIKISVSLGFAVVDTRVDAEYDRLKHVAAAALQEAKSQGRNRCLVRTVEHDAH